MFRRIWELPDPADHHDVCEEFGDWLTSLDCEMPEYLHLIMDLLGGLRCDRWDRFAATCGRYGFRLWQGHVAAPNDLDVFVLVKDWD